jgi:hypothetical protein
MEGSKMYTRLQKEAQSQFFSEKFQDFHTQSLYNPVQVIEDLQKKERDGDPVLEIPNENPDSDEWMTVDASKLQETLDQRYFSSSSSMLDEELFGKNEDSDKEETEVL